MSADFPRDERGFTVVRNADDDRTSRVLPLQRRLEKTLGELGVRRAVAEAAGDSEPDPKWVAPADDLAVRGIPAIGSGVGGALSGSRPDTIVGLDPYTRRKLARRTRAERSDPLRPRQRRRSR
jgi:hypothetical protein